MTRFVVHAQQNGFAACRRCLQTRRHLVRLPRRDAWIVATGGQHYSGILGAILYMGVCAHLVKALESVGILDSSPFRDLARAILFKLAAQSVSKAHLYQRCPK